MRIMIVIIIITEKSKDYHFIYLHETQQQPERTCKKNKTTLHSTKRRRLP